MELFFNIIQFTFQYHLYDLLISYWGDCLIVKNFFKDRHYNFYTEIKYRFNAIIHAIYTAFFVTLYLSGLSHSEGLNIVFANSMAYCIYDMYSIIYKEDSDPHRKEFIVHHVMMFLVLFLNYGSTNMNRVNILCASLLTEWSTFFLNISIVLYKSGYSSTLTFNVNKWLTLSSYFSFRIVMFAYLIYLTYLESLFFAIIAVFFYSLNWFWFYKLIQQTLNKKQKKVM